MPDRWTCDMRVHLRWEAYNLDALDAAIADIEAGRVHLLAFNDHTPSILKKLQDPVAGAKYSGAPGMKMEEFRAMADRVGGRADAVPAALDRIAAAARAAGLPMASHDDDSIAVRDEFRARGAADLRIPDGGGGWAAAAVEAGDFVVMGMPQRGARRVASRLGLGGATGGGGDLHCADIGLLLSGDDAGRVHPGRAGGVGPASGLGADFGRTRHGPRGCGSGDDRGGKAGGSGGGRSRDVAGVATIARGHIAYLTAVGAGRLSVRGVTGAVRESAVSGDRFMP